MDETLEDEISVEEFEDIVFNILDARDLSIDDYAAMARRRKWPSRRMAIEWVIIGAYARAQGLYP